MEPRLMDVLQGKEDNYILPFFWQHGESKELLEEGMQRIYDSGIKAVCVESRPHPDFVGEGWWRDLDIIMAKAKELNMRVWVLDDAHFPSGFCNGKIAPDSPYGKVYLTQYGVDIVGPKQGRSVLIILEQGEELVAVTMGKRDRNNQDSLTEVKEEKIILIRLIMMLCVILLIRYMSLIMHTIKMILEKHLQDFSLMSLKSEALAANMVMMLRLENSI